MYHRVRADEGGMTLIELIIAVVIMAIISVGILTSVTTLSGASENHRGIANVDGATQSYAEAVKNHVNFHTTLSSAITSSQTSFSVANAAELSTAAPTAWSTPAGGAFTCTPACGATAVEVVVDGELMQVGSVSGTTPSSITRGDRTTSATKHSSGATLNPIYTPCPMAAQLSPVSFTLPAHVSSVRITEIDYWIPSSSTFEIGQKWNGTQYVLTGSGHSDCEAAFLALCPTYNGGHDDGGNWATTFDTNNLAQCDPGLERIWITATGDATTGNSVTITSLLVRRGNG